MKLEWESFFQLRKKMESDPTKYCSNGKDVFTSDPYTTHTKLVAFWNSGRRYMGEERSRQDHGICMFLFHSTANMDHANPICTSSHQTQKINKKKKKENFTLLY